MSEVTFKECDVPQMIYQDQCTCLRPRKTVLCKFCGFFIHGRIKIPCPVHPLTVFLHDLEQCPKCRAYTYMLSEIEKKEKIHKKV